jgi:ABC transporter DrrB family efflux protein
VLLFVYVFGSAMDVGPDIDFKDFALPGMFAMTMAFGFMGTAMMMAVDKERGITDRFRSMPMSSSAVVTGRGVSDVLQATLDLLVMTTIALIVGWRPNGGFLDAVAAFGLLLLLRFALIWIGVLLGLLVKNQESAGNLFAIAFPFGMISSVFTPPHMMPDWLGTIAMWNPVSATANAVRELFGNPVPHGGSWIESHALLMAVVWPLIITAVFLPLAVRKYHSLSR